MPLALSLLHWNGRPKENCGKWIDCKTVLGDLSQAAAKFIRCPASAALTPARLMCLFYRAHNLGLRSSMTFALTQKISPSPGFTVLLKNRYFPSGVTLAEASLAEVFILPPKLIASLQEPFFAEN